MKKSFFIVAASLAVFYVAFISLDAAKYPSVANAQSSSSSSSSSPTSVPVPTALTGWGWSSTIGWINLNNENGKNGNIVKINQSTGDLTGYAWSSNIGWIKFGGLSAFPSTGSPDGNAKVNLSTGAVTGWARACAGAADGKCTSMDSRIDGWDGWLELAGVNHSTMKMDLVKGNLSGFAWGGPVIGWVKFGEAESLSLNATCSGTLSGTNVTFTASATGGSGTYQYDWGTGWSTASIKTVTRTETDPTIPTTAQFLLRDANNSSNVVGPISCRFPDVGGAIYPITGECMVGSNPTNFGKSVSIDLGGSVIFALNLSSLENGVPPYESSYIWNTGESFSDSSTPTYTHTYEKVGTYNNTSVTVTDSVGKSSNIVCGNVNVVDPSSHLDLKIGSSGSEAVDTTYRIRQGSEFGLGWSNSFPIADYNCDAGGSTNLGSAFSDWLNSVDITTDGTKDYNGAYTKSVSTGDYNFSISCNEIKNPSNKFEEKVNLKIYSVSEGEI